MIRLALGTAAPAATLAVERPLPRGHGETVLVVDDEPEIRALTSHLLQAAGYDVLNEVTLNQVMVAFGDDAITRNVIAAVQQEGTCWAGATTWRL